MLGEGGISERGEREELTCFFCLCPEELSASELKKLQRKERKAQHKAQAKAQEEKKGVCVCSEYSGCVAKVEAFLFFVCVICAVAENKVPSKGDPDKSGPDDRKTKFVASDLLNVSCTDTYCF